MANLSQEKRQRMLAFLDTIRQEHKDDDDVLIALGEIESELNAKKYGLIWEQHEEAVDVMMRTHIPVFTEDAGKEITTSAGGVDINHIYAAPVCLFQQTQAMQIIAFKEKIIEIKTRYLIQFNVA